MCEKVKSPWSKNELFINLILMITLIILATILIILKNWVILIFYLTLWLIIIFVGRALFSRHCDYLGKTCPTWCLGIIGGRIYKRSNKKDFTEIKIWNFYLDVLLIALMMLFPLIMYIIYLFIEVLSIIEWFLLIVYLVIGITTFVFHTKGCKKCNIKGCPFGRKQIIKI